MDGKEAIGSKKSSPATADFDRSNKLKVRLEQLLREAAEVEVELSRTDGTIKGIPHYSVIEGRAHELGKQLSREVQQRQMNELAASQAMTAKCPECGTWCQVRVKQRGVKSVDGDTPLHELVGDCPCCRRAFFPDA
jgi:hypothetical protein